MEPNGFGTGPSALSSPPSLFRPGRTFVPEGISPRNVSRDPGLGIATNVALRMTLKRRTTRHGDRGTKPAERAAAREERLQRLRTTQEEQGQPRILIATLRAHIPRGIWTGPFSSRHPELRLEVLNRTDVTADTSVSDYWIGGGEPGEWAEEIGSFGDVLQADPLAAVGEGCLYRIKYRNPPVVDVYRRLRLPLQFPLRIQAGFLTWEVVSKYAEFQQILAHARRADAGVQVTSLRRGPLRSHLPMLTDTQQQLLTEAMTAGYFAVPREITLTELSRKLNRSKSAISEGIAIIEKRLVESALHAGSLT